MEEGGRTDGKMSIVNLLSKTWYDLKGLTEFVELITMKHFFRTVCCFPFECVSMLTIMCFYVYKLRDCFDTLSDFWLTLHF